MGPSPSIPSPMINNRKQLKNSSIQPIRLSTEQPSRSHQQTVPTQQRHHRQHESQWPLPPDEVWPEFHLTVNDDLDRYSLTNVPPRIATAALSSKHKTSTTETYNQKDTSNVDWEEKKIDSKIKGSAHVQSQLSSRFHACFNLAAYENINGVMDGLKNTHKDLDTRLNRRLTQISKDTEDKIKLIVDDTIGEQNRLLAYDKERQIRQDQLYQEWLQMYISELNKWRSEQLAKLQTKLLDHQQKIVVASKRKIDHLNTNANALKTQILQEEQEAVIQKTNNLTSGMYNMTSEESHYLGSESKTELNLRIQANVGRIMPGQSCTNDPVSSNNVSPTNNGV